MKQFLNYLMVLAFLCGCREDSLTPADNGLSFYPLQTGDYRVYKVNEIIYSEVAQPKTLNYQLMTEVVDSFPSGNEIVFVMHRLTRTDESKPWQMLDTWSVRKNDRQLIVSEGNIPFVKLIFPPKAGTAWDGNEFNTESVDDYEITEVVPALDLNGLTLEETVTVTQENNDDVIVYFDQREEKYSKNVGLVSRKIRQFQYCTLDACLGQQIIKSGTDYSQEIISYGRN